MEGAAAARSARGCRRRRQIHPCRGLPPDLPSAAATVARSTRGRRRWIYSWLWLTLLDLPQEGDKRGGGSRRRRIWRGRDPSPDLPAATTAGSADGCRQPATTAAVSTMGGRREGEEVGAREARRDGGSHCRRGRRAGQIEGEVGRVRVLWGEGRS